MEIVAGTEDEVYVELTKAGYKLFNAKGGNRSAIKKRRTLSTFTTLNRQALVRMEEADRVERRARLHGKAQVLTKPEVMRQRVLNDTPTLEALLEAPWKDCPAGLLSSKIDRTAERAEYLRWGDYTVYVAYRSKDREVCCVARQMKGDLWANGATWTQCPKLRVLELLLNHWAAGEAAYPGWLKRYE
jgi:hypothetical protein